MHNNAPDNSPTFLPPTARRRPDRPGRGIGVPTTLWLPPAESDPHDPCDPGAVLPAWALRRVVTEYATPDHAVVAIDSRDYQNENRILAYEPLSARHDPHAATRPRPRRNAVHLAVLEIETGTDPYPIRLLHDFVNPALRAAACHLAPGAILAIALSSPAPGRAAACTSEVLASATGHGFAFQQHLVVVTAEIRGDFLVPRFTDAEATALDTARQAGIPAPAPAHLDLVIATLTDKEPHA